MVDTFPILGGLEKDWIMVWRERSVMELREEFVRLAMSDGANRRELCRRFGISAQTGYKWLRRYAAEGRDGLADRPRRPRTSPARVAPAVEAAVLAVRAASNQAWGGRKIRRRLHDLGHASVPSASTITEILRRHDKLEAGAAAGHAPWRRFERDRPNELWQMDFKGHFATATGRCHPLTVLDDHSRYALGLAACADERAATVQDRLRAIFRRYGLPEAMLMDNGAPWGDAGDQPHTVFTAWLMRLGIRIAHGRPYHPQTQGKDERFHRSLKAEVLAGRRFADLDDCQGAFSHWRHVYNHQRPHEALELDVPATRYRPSAAAFPETLPEIEYGPGDVVRKVQSGGAINFQGRPFRVSKAFKGQPVALRPSEIDGVFTVRFLANIIARIDLREAQDETQTACGFDGQRKRVVHNPTGATAANLD